MSKFYAVVQAGTTAFGVGISIEEARSNALEWMENQEQMPFIRWDSEWHDAVMQGNVVTVECSESFFNAISDDPTEIQNWDDSMLKTDSEVE